MSTSLETELVRWAHERLFVAFSGGLDSTVLLKECSLIAPEVRALHVNHGLHADAERWQAHCQAVCEQLGVAFAAYPVDVRPGNVEVEARNARYAVFEEVLGPGDLLLMGHHRDDQAENVLLRLFQGRAQLAMPRTRQLPGGAMLVRPFLGVGRVELETIASAYGLDWIEDSANAELRHDRNFLRHEILPALRSRWPDVEAVLVRAADTQQGMDALLTFMIDDAATLQLESFPEALRRSVLRVWLRQFGEFAATDRALEEFIAQFEAPKDRQPVLELSRGWLRRHEQAACYVAKLELQERYCLDPPAKLKLPHGTLTIDRVEPVDTEGFVASGQLQVRFRQGGERIGRRSVKKLLQRTGVAPWLRATYPLVYEGDRLVAVPNIATDTSTSIPTTEDENAAGRGDRATAHRWRAQWTPDSPSFVVEP